MSAQISLYKFNILVVDDNAICLNIISSMLRRWNYEVITINCPLNALAITRVRDIDLVLTDLHMPKMNGIELQKQIEAEAKLPVIIMSSDDNQKIIMESLSSGAAFFLSKPVNLVDLKNLWQHIVASKRDKSMRCIEKIGGIQGAGSSAIRKTSCNGDTNIASSVNKGKHTKNKKISKIRKSHPKKLENMEEENSAAPKKRKVVWDTALHNRFLQAIRHITLEKAVPKNILELMNVPGLTRANVASHLQKYRIFLKKVAEKDFSATFKNSQEAYVHFKGVLPFPYFDPTNFGSIGGHSSSNSGLASFSSLTPLAGFGQSCLLGSSTQANAHKPFLGNISPLFQSNNTNDFGVERNDIGTNILFSSGDIPKSGTNSMQMIPNDGCNNMSTSLLGTSSVWKPNYVAPSNGAQILDLGVGSAGDSTFSTCLAAGKSSCAGFNGNYQSLTSLPGVNFEQGSTSALPSMAQQQFDLENKELNGFISGLINDNNNDASSFSRPQKFGEFSNMLMMKSTNFQSPHHQQQGPEGFENPNFASNSSFPPETNLPASQPLDDLDYRSSFNVVENHPWDEPSFEQLLEIEELLTSHLEDNIANSLDHYHPLLEEHPYSGLG